MKCKGLRNTLAGLLILATNFSLNATFPNLNSADPYPLFSSVYPYDYLAARQKAGLMRFDYTYAENRFRVSLSGFRQSASCGKDTDYNTVNLGDMKGRWNMLGLLYDPKLRGLLLPAIGADSIPEGCEGIITDPRLVDPNKEFGFFSIPLKYRKFGVRFDTQIILIDRCYYAVGLEVQWGISDVRQTVKFQDFTGQALGKAAPGGPRGVLDTVSTSPIPFTPVPGIATPYVDPTTLPPCAQAECNVFGATDCITPLQPFSPIDTETLSQSFPATCKEWVIDNLMNVTQREKIADVLGLNFCDYHKIALDDLRISAFWRHIFVINEEDERYPRVLFMPFAQVGVGIPMSKEINNKDMFALPVANNHHTFVGGLTGFTIDFLDTIDLSVAGGFSYFFKQEHCNFRMPTNSAESGIFPYAADIILQPGPTWHFNIGMHAWHFLDNLSVWAEYCILSHADDKITVCRSLIPEDSIYFEHGFDVERAECFSKWEAQVANIGFNYDLFDNLAIGLVWQAPIKRRNAYRTGTILGTISFLF